jgi:hypothetical protein
MASEGPFHIEISCDETALIPLLRETIRETEKYNLMPMLKPEQMVDAGPHLRHFSPTLQDKAREDWLDMEFLRCWSEHLNGVRLIDSDSTLGAELLRLL